MEYEQVEYGRRVVTEAIISQDINDYYDVLSPQVLLVTHFPYPSASADSNMQAVHRWVQMSERQHIAAVDAASAAAAAAAAAASSAAAGGRGSVNINTGNQLSAAAAAPAPTAGACSARSQKRRARELLQRQEQWRITQQQRYDSFRKLRELHHSCVADEGDGDNDVGGTGSTDGAARDGKEDAAAASEQCAADGRGAPAAPQPQRQQTRTDKQRLGQTFAKATSARDHASNGGGSAAAAAAARAADGVHWFQQQQARVQLQPPEQRTRSSTFLSSDVSAVSAAAAAAAATAAQKRPASRGNPIAYEDAVTITEGKLLVSYRFFQLLHWIVSSDGKTAPPAHIAPIEVDLQLRKDILQEAEVLAPPPAPTTVQEAYSQLGQQFTERNQPLSCVRTVWGTDHLLFEDKIFFDDGLIVTIHRRMLTVPEVLTRAAPAASSSPKTLRELPPAPLSSPQTRLSEKGSAASLPTGKGGLTRKREQHLSAARSEQVYHAVEAFYGMTATRVDACSNAWALLDFSFVKATEPSMLLRLTPVSGHVHVNRLPRAAADPRLSQGIFLNQENDPTKPQQSGSSRTLIKARNKYGEEEAYEFQTQRHCFSFYEDGSGRGAGGGDAGAPQRNGNRALGGDGGAGAARYDASCVRVSGCHMQAKMDQLVPVLRRLVVNCLLTLHTLDLSQNNISSLPDLSLLPLQSLRLHGNAIADWRVVEARIAPLPYLGVLTLHGNPIAEDTEIEAVAGNSSKTAARDAHCAGTVGKAAKGSRADGDSNYWKRLLALLLRSPDRVAPLRQVDFVTLTGQDYNMAGAYEMFTRGQTGLLAKARSMMGSRTQTKPAGATTSSSSKSAHVVAGRG
ncbi:protein of unknown function - conserved [Leishmania donovani]|uniref:Leucine-rich repeat-containing protein 51 n=1 Tax=Leishmania donovani TaxID=5661 RepID=A0A6J8F447_LEIDO|nr:protein of unknown function - conserved [Leishmania donovani]VDZ42164.1 hypothetical_protein_conserved [Leishmania donovani]